MTARILIVEDEALVAMELRFVLEDLEHEVVDAVADAASAMDRASRLDVDLALVDVHLSDGPSGVQLGCALADRGLTVVYMTANPGMVTGGVHGPLGVLSKPVDETAVKCAVDYALKRRRGEPVQYAPPELTVFS